MNRRQAKTLTAIFDTPVRRNIAWRDLVSLLTALGCASDEKARGSVVGFAAPDGLRFTLHRPHPGHELAPYQVLAVREFIEKIGGKP